MATVASIPSNAYDSTSFMDGMVCNMSRTALVSWEEVFWSRVDRQQENDCWLWMRPRGKQGYGEFRFKNCPEYRPHRVAWVLTNGRIPHGMFLCHHCDNPACVNPKHMFVGTQKDNMSDASKKGRIVGGKAGRRGRKSGRQDFTAISGENNYRAVLTEEDVAEMRRLYAQGNMSQTALADKYGVDQPSIWKALLGVSWKCVVTDFDDAAKSVSLQRRKTKITRDVACSIKARINSGEATIANLAQEHNLHYSSIRKILSGRTWGGE